MMSFLNMEAWQNACIATDGAKEMVDYKTGLVELYKEKGMNSLFFHCIIVQEALCRINYKAQSDNENSCKYCKFNK